MDRDYGWIHTLLEEAENERMHLLTFIKLKRPGILFRTAVLATQGIFMNAFFFAYIIHPRFCHRFVGYLEEEAVKTYTDIINAMDDGRLAEMKDKPAPEIARAYWRMEDNATLRNLMMVVRADESNHRYDSDN
jgi:Alternative oxidase